jgi:thiosulfate/3-mercaptopyruvate sulfurtransferase
MYTTLISAENLSSQIHDRQFVILDCRHDLTDTDAGQRAYDQGHLPHALFIHLDKYLSGPKTNEHGIFQGRHPLPDKVQFIATMRAFGVNDDTQVIAYDAHGGMFAARLWWMLRWVGHQAVAVLDGGLSAWQATGQTLSTEIYVPETGHLHERPSLVKQVGVQDVIENLSTAARILVDARAPDRFRGENETMDPVGGHIPGARNRFFKDNLQADGRFKPGHQLQQEWHTILSDADKAIMQCGSGVTACHNLLALELAGMHGAALYPGSWSEWCADSHRPVER